MLSLEISKYMLIYLANIERVKGSKKILNLIYLFEQEKDDQKNGIESLLDYGIIAYKEMDNRLKIWLTDETAPYASFEDVDKKITSIVLYNINDADLLEKNKRNIIKIAEYKETAYGLIKKPYQVKYKIEVDMDNGIVITDKTESKVLKDGNIEDKHSTKFKKISKDDMLNYLSMFNFLDLEQKSEKDH